MLNILWVVFLCSWKLGNCPHFWHSPFGNPLLPFEVREAVCLWNEPFVPCLDSMSNEYIRVFGPRVPSFTFVWSCLLSSHGLTLHSVPLFTAESYYIVYMSSIFRIRSWMDTDFLRKTAPGFSVRAVLEEAPKALCGSSSCVLAWVVREFWIASCSGRWGRVVSNFRILQILCSLICLTAFLKKGSSPKLPDTRRRHFFMPHFFCPRNFIRLLYWSRAGLQRCFS